MSSNSRWGPSSSSTSLPHPSSSQPIRRPPQPSAADESFLWLSTSYNTEGGNPLGSTAAFPQDSGNSSSQPTLTGGKSSKKAGYYKMSSPTFPPNSSQQSSSNPPHTSSAGAAAKHTLSPTSNDTRLDTAALRSSWTSTDSDDTGKASITQSDFEFLTPSFIAIDNPPTIGGRDARSRNGEGAANGGAGGTPSATAGHRVTKDSHTLGRMHNLDRESAVLPPASVRSEPQTPGFFEEGIDAYYYIQQQDEPTSATALLSPPSTAPLHIRKPSTQANTPGRDRRLPSVPQDVSPLPTQTQHRFYHQPPPRIDPPPPSRQQLRHVHSDETTASAETTKTGTTGITFDNNAAGRNPLSTARPQPQLTSSNAAGVTYPPTAFADRSLKRKESNSKTSGHSAASGGGYVASGSVSPSTSASVSLGVGGTGEGSKGSPAISLTGLMSGGGRPRGNSGSDGRHPYASSSAYRMAVTDYRDDPNNPFPNTYGSSFSKEKDGQQHPFSAYRPPQQKNSTAEPDPYSRRSGHEGYTSDGSQSGHGSQQQYGIAIGSLPPSSKPSPMLSYSKSTSNVGHGGVSDIEGRYANGLGNGNEKGDSFGGRNPTSKEAAGSSPGKTTKREKRQSTATLLSLRIRNIYPVPSASNRGSGAGSTPRTVSKAISSRTSQADGYQLQDGEEENIDLQILRWFGMACIFLAAAGVIPLLGTVYVSAGHAILRAKATSDANGSPFTAGSALAVESAYLRSTISHSAKAGALGGTILALPVVLLVFTAVGPDAIVDFKRKLLRWTRSTFLTFGADEEPEDEKPQRTPASIDRDRRRSRRASSLWGPSAASTSFKEQSTAELSINVATNILLAVLFLSLGAACAALGVTILSPTSSLSDNPYLSPSTAALSGLVGGAVVFGGAVILGGVLAWVIYEGGKPVSLEEQQLAIGSVPVQGVNVGVPIAGGGKAAAVGQGVSVRSGSTFMGGQPTVKSVDESPVGRWV